MNFPTSNSLDEIKNLRESNMLSKDILEAIKFIVDNGGSDYYRSLLDNKEKINYKEEVSDIKHLFKVGLEEFNWDTEKVEFMQKYIDQ